jgi:hypothetical protein
MSSLHDVFYVRLQHESVFLNQVKEALQVEILCRQGFVTTSPEGSFVIDLSVDVVRWGSLWRSQPVRREAVWKASIVAGGRVLLAAYEPFYIFDADIPLYENTENLGVALAGSARPLSYSTQ